MRLPVIAGLTVCLLGATAPAAAYEAPGPRWRGGTIRYHETFPPSWNWSLRKAVTTWNESGARVRLREVPRDRAQVVVGYGSTGGNAGLATIGRRPGAFLKIEPLLYRPLRPRDRISAAVVLAHEFGHVLGLGHSPQKPCRLMSPRPLTYCPGAPQTWQYYCRWLAPADLRTALRLYGGTDRRRASPWCPLEPRPPGLSVQFEPTRITWQPTETLPKTRVRIEIYPPNRCAGETTAPLLGVVERRLRPRVWRPAQPGPACLRVGLLGARGRPGPVTQGPIG